MGSCLTHLVIFGAGGSFLLTTAQIKAMHDQMFGSNGGSGGQLALNVLMSVRLLLFLE